MNLGLGIDKNLYGKKNNISAVLLLKDGNTSCVVSSVYEHE